MLSSEICYKCALENDKKTHIDYDGFWLRWGMGFVRCRVKLWTGERGFTFTGINGEPPDGCPYFLEHIVNA